MWFDTIRSMNIEYSLISRKYNKDKAKNIRQEIIRNPWKLNKFKMDFNKMVVSRPYGRENDGYNRPYDGYNRPDDGYNRPNGYRPTNYDSYNGREDGYSKEGAYRTIGIRADSIPYRDYTNIMKNGIKNTIILE